MPSKDRPGGQHDADGAATTKGESQPIQAFGAFFKNYALGLSVIVAALPLAAVKLDVLPQFDSMKPLLAIIGSGSSFFLVSVIFARRHNIARLFFPGWHRGDVVVARTTELKSARVFAWVPVVLSLAALVAIVAYFDVMNGAVKTIAYRNAEVVRPVDSAAALGAAETCQKQRPGAKPLRFTAIVRNFGPPERVGITCSVRASTDSKEEFAPIFEHDLEFFDNRLVDSIRARAAAASIPNGMPMNIFFFVAFAAASSAFVLTGLKDYLQRDLGLSDRQLIRQQISEIRAERFDVRGVPNLHGIVEYTPGYLDLATTSRPLCAWHDLEPIPSGPDPVSGQMKWIHIRGDAPKTPIPCTFTSELTVGQIDRRFRESWEAIVRGDSPTASSSNSAAMMERDSSKSGTLPPVVPPTGRVST